MIEDLVSFGGYALQPQVYECIDCGRPGCIHDLINEQIRRDGMQNDQSLLTPQDPFQGGYDLPESGCQIHLHGPNPDTITEGHLKLTGTDSYGPRLNGCDASMAALGAQQIGLKPFGPIAEGVKPLLPGIGNLIDPK